MKCDEQRGDRGDTAEQDTIEKLRADLSVMQERQLETSVLLMQLQKVVMELIERVAENQETIRGGLEQTGKIIAELGEQKASIDPDDPYNVKRLGDPA